MQVIQPWNHCGNWNIQDGEQNGGPPVVYTAVRSKVDILMLPTSVVFLLSVPRLFFVCVFVFSYVVFGLCLLVPHPSVF